MVGGQSKEREFIAWRVPGTDKVFNDCVVVERRVVVSHDVMVVLWSGDG